MYHDGTYTATLNSNFQEGIYTRIGNQVTCSGVIKMAGNPDEQSEALSIHLPFTNRANPINGTAAVVGSVLAEHGFNKGNTGSVCHISPGLDLLYFYENNLYKVNLYFYQNLF